MSTKIDQGIEAPKSGTARKGDNDGITWKPARVKGKTGYLSMRNRTVCNVRNEIAVISNGTPIKVNLKKHRKEFVWARFYGLEGWVDKDCVEVL